MTSFDEWFEHLRAMVVKVGATLEPDEDWAPTLFMQNPQGQSIIAQFDVLDDEDAKEEIFERVLPRTVLEEKAVRVGMVMMAWMVTREAGEDDESAPPPSEHPDKVEILALWATDLHGELRYETTTVLRRPGLAPTVGEWRAIEGASVSGRAIDPIRKMLAYLREAAEDPVALMERLAAESESPEIAEMARMLAQVGRDDPEAIESMPVRRWLRGVS